MSLDISIIIPVYNKVDSMHFSLDSLLRQTYTNFEVLIIDDGSTDNTVKVIDKYVKEDSRFKYVFQENAGVSMARNKGLEIAKGSYVCFLDADDFYENTFLEKMYIKIKTSKTDVCYSGYNVITPNKLYQKKSNFKEKTTVIDYILGNISINTNGWMIKRDLIEQYNISFPQGVRWGEDFEFFCEVLSRTEKVSFVKEYLTNYRIDFNENQLSTFSIKRLDWDYNSIKRLQNNVIVNKNELVERALIDYRLSARLTYGLIKAVRLGEDRESFVKYFNKYKEHLIKLTWNNGLRSVKLNINKFLLLIYMRYIIKC